MAAPKVHLEWYGDEVSQTVRQHVRNGMTAACQDVVDDVKQRLNRGQPTRAIKSGPNKGDRYGLDPSKPGEPPKVVSSLLKNTITSRVEEDQGAIRGFVGSPMEYARRLELGFVGVDAWGRMVNQAPRPFLRPAVLENRKLILETISRG